MLIEVVNVIKALIEALTALSAAIHSLREQAVGGPPHQTPKTP